MLVFFSLFLNDLNAMRVAKPLHPSCGAVVHYILIEQVILDEEPDKMYRKDVNSWKVIGFGSYFSCRVLINFKLHSFITATFSCKLMRGMNNGLQGYDLHLPLLPFSSLIELNFEDV